MARKNSNANLSNKKRKGKSRAVEKTALPRSSVKKRKNNRKRKIVKILKWTCIIGLIVGAIVFLLTTPIFNVKEIEVIGNEQISTEEIQSLSQIQLNQNMFKYMKSTIVSNVKENPYIESVKVKRILPDKIQITVEERYIKFMIQLLNSYAYINSQGYILEINENPKDVPIIEGFSTPEEDIIAGNRLNVDDLEKLETVLKIVSLCEENEIGSYITTINTSDTNEYTIYFEEKGKTAYIGDNSNLSTKILYVKAIMDAEEGNLGEIFVNGDLNDNFKPYFREKI